MMRIGSGASPGLFWESGSTLWVWHLRRNVATECSKFGVTGEALGGPPGWRPPEGSGDRRVFVRPSGGLESISSLPLFPASSFHPAPSGRTPRPPCSTHDRTPDHLRPPRPSPHQRRGLDRRRGVAGVRHPLGFRRGTLRRDADRTGRGACRTTVAAIARTPVGRHRFPDSVTPRW